MAGIAKNIFMGMAPRCVRTRMNLPHGYYHAVVIFKSYADHNNFGDPPRYVNTVEPDIHRYNKLLDGGYSDATPKEVAEFARRYGPAYQQFGRGARNCQDFAMKLFQFLVENHSCSPQSLQEMMY